jgi:hypothetical protein
MTGRSSQDEGWLVGGWQRMGPAGWRWQADGGDLALEEGLRYDQPIEEAIQCEANRQDGDNVGEQNLCSVVRLAQRDQEALAQIEQAIRRTGSLTPVTLASGETAHGD